MNAVPMVERCLELQRDDLIPAPLEAVYGNSVERIPEGFLSWPVSEWCDPCGCDHGRASTWTSEPSASTAPSAPGS